MKTQPSSSLINKYAAGFTAFSSTVKVEHTYVRYQNHAFYFHALIKKKGYPLLR